MTFLQAKPEYGKGLDGFADIVVFDKLDRPWLVIEAKKKIEERYVRNIDPFSPIVVRQAHRYASQLGAPYFATYNGSVLVLFRTEERFVPLLQRKTKSYLVKNVAKFAPELLREVIELEVGDGKWDPMEDAFIFRLEEFQRRLFVQFDKTLAKKLVEDKIFSQLFKTWIKLQGWEVNETIQHNFARQASYLLMNKLVFFKILQNEQAYKEYMPTLDVEAPDVSERLRRAFNAVIKNVDFEVVFEHDPIFDEIPLTNSINEELIDFLDELDEYDLSKFSSDVIGRIYEKIIPPKARHDLGQYYTPPEVCELIALLTIKSPDSHILDPAVGSGGFLVKAYERLKGLKKEAGLPIIHNQIINQLHAIDINRFPAHLTAINLALRNLSSKTEDVDVEVSDFFDVRPQQKRIIVERAGAKGKRIVEMTAPSKVDVVLGNPPYIRQEKIGDKNKVRHHLNSLGSETISDRSDIYCYFFTHSYEFLKEGGNLSFITSNRWLTVGYGKEIQKFLLDRFKIRAIITFDNQVFKEPLIGTVITLLEKCDKESNRNHNVVQFWRFKRKIDLRKILEKVETNYKRNLFFEDGEFRLVTKQQNDLYIEEKWYKYLYAPTLYFEISSHEKMTSLIELADVSRGITSNANQFFYFKGREEIENWGIEDFFVSPLIKHVRQTEFIKLLKEDSNWWVLDLHDIIEEILSNVDKSLFEDKKPVEVVKQELKKRGHIGLLNYLNHGEEIGIHKRASLCSRKVWFDLKDLPRPPIMLSEVYWRKAQVIYNKDKLTLDKRLYSIYPKKNLDPFVLLGIMNSDLLLFMREIEGRVEEGQAMNRNTLMVYEAEALKILDPRKLSLKERKRILRAFTELVENERTVDDEKLKKLCIELNTSVLAPLGIEDRVEELEKIIGNLLLARIKGAGLHSEVIIEVEESERQQIMRITGAIPQKRKHRSARVTLDDFIA